MTLLAESTANELMMWLAVIASFFFFHSLVSILLQARTAAAPQKRPDQTRHGWKTADPSAGRA